MGFLPWEIRVAFSVESRLRQSRANQPTVHAGCFSVSIIHRTLTWTTGSLTCAQMLMHAIAHGGRMDTLRESALKGDSGRKIPCRTGKSNLFGRRTGPMLYQLSYIPTPFRRSESFWWIRLLCPVLQPNCGQKWYAARSFGSPHINSAGRQWWKERIKMRSTENTSWCKSVTFIDSAFAGS